MFDNIEALLKPITYDINILTPQRTTVPAHTHPKRNPQKTKTTRKTKKQPNKQTNKQKKICGIGLS